MRATLYALLLLPLLPSAASATEDIGMPTAAVRAYEAYSRAGTATLGSMMLGTGSAEFAKLKGTMRLEAAGRLPDDGSSMTGGALVFRVLNADALFREDRRCDAPI